MTLDITGLVVEYPGVRAVDDVSLSVRAGECYALVGESGCGKTTLARAVVGLVRARHGSIRVEGREIHGQHGKALRKIRRRVQIVFQNPYAALNPRMTVARLIEEPLRLVRSRLPVGDLLEQVGLDGRHTDRYPHELSGGQCQRVAIARALAVRPGLLVLDEPTSALDVSVQAQILNLLSRLRAERGLSYLLISHDLAVVRHLSERVGVMRAGRLLEQGETGKVLTEPEHPYTRALLDAVPGRGRAALLAEPEGAPR